MHLGGLLSNLPCGNEHKFTITKRYTRRRLLNKTEVRAPPVAAKPILDTVEPPFATTSRKRSPPMSDHFSKIQRVFKLNYY